MNKYVYNVTDTYPSSYLLEYIILRHVHFTFPKIFFVTPAITSIISSHHEIVTPDFNFSVE